MELITYSSLKQKLQNDFDISDERFVTETELLGYINEAIDDAEKLIHTLHHEDKYFLAPGTITLVNGTADYGFPSDIYANKLRAIWYQNGGTKYPITKLKDLLAIPYIQAGDPYQYVIINTTASGVKIRLYPTPAESGAYVPIWYVRNMARMTTSSGASNVCEVPECTNFVEAHVKRNLQVKTGRMDLIALRDQERTNQYNLMHQTLGDMTLDQDTLAPIDLSSYVGQGGFYGT